MDEDTFSTLQKTIASGLGLSKQDGEFLLSIYTLQQRKRQEAVKEREQLHILWQELQVSRAHRVETQNSLLHLLQKLFLVSVSSPGSEGGDTLRWNAYDETSYWFYTNRPPLARGYLDFVEAYKVGILLVLKQVYQLSLSPLSTKPVRTIDTIPHDNDSAKQSQESREEDGQQEAVTQPKSLHGRDLDHEQATTLMHTLHTQRERIQAETEGIRRSRFDIQLAREKIQELTLEIDALCTMLVELFSIALFSTSRQDHALDIQEKEDSYRITYDQSRALAHQCAFGIEQVLAHQGVVLETRFALVIFSERAVLETRSGDRFRQNPQDWTWRTGRGDALSKLIKAGVQVAVAGNQGGVGRGHLPEQEMQEELEKMAGDYSLRLYVCYSHPQASDPRYYHENDPRRFPNPGMLLEAMHDSNVDPTQTLFVGAATIEREAAQAAGCGYVDASVYFPDDLI